MRLLSPTVDLSIEAGTLPKAVAQAVEDAGVDVNPELLYLWFQIGRIQYRHLIQEKSPYGEYQIEKYIANPDAIKKCVYYKNTWQAQDGHIYNLMITTIQNDLIDALKTNTLLRITKETANLEEN